MTIRLDKASCHTFQRKKYLPVFTFCPASVLSLHYFTCFGVFLYRLKPNSLPNPQLLCTVDLTHQETGTLSHKVKLRFLGSYPVKETWSSLLLWGEMNAQIVIQFMAVSNVHHRVKPSTQKHYTLVLQICNTEKYLEPRLGLELPNTSTWANGTGIL